jgi:hypothetical protein
MATSGGLWGTCVDAEVVCRCPWGMPLPALYWATDKVGGCDNPIRDNSVLSPKPLNLVIKR